MNSSKKIIILILIFNFHFSVSQNLKKFNIKYIHKGIFSSLNDSKGTLIINPNISIYTLSPNNKEREESEMDLESMSFNITIPLKEDLFFIKDIKKNMLTSKENIFTKTFVVKDSIPKISWKIYDEEKTVANTFKCKKAIGKFRGRIYTAWFTPKIPISNGPWKLGGLPGLILEAYDEKKEIIFEFVSLTQSNNNISLIKVLKNIETKKAIDWEEHKTLFRKKMKHFNSSLKSSSSGDTEINVTKINLIEKSILEDEK